jgi:hypothetical protein
MRQKNTERIVNESSVEVWVTYAYKPIYQIEECHGLHDMSYDDVTLESVEVKIGDNYVDILKQLTSEQEDIIIGELSIH